MNDIERYFNEFGHLSEEEFSPKTTESEFLAKLHGRTRLRRIRALTYTVSGIAAALVIIIGIWWSRGTENPAVLCAESYVQGMEVLRDDVISLESGSERCREMGISSIIGDLMASSERYAEDIDEMTDSQTADAVRTYCDRQMERVRELYRECVMAYEEEREDGALDSIGI